MSESKVKSYCNSFPVTFTKAKDEILIDDNGKKYIDFFAGAGALSYGHNNDELKKDLLDYIKKDYITHGLDLQTPAKQEFIKIFHKNILEPRNLDYLMQFTSPSGTNANEAAMKLARKYTKRKTIFSFTGNFHGMSTGSLSITGNSYYREGIPMSSSDVVFMPFEKGFMDELDSIKYIENILSNPSSGVDIPAAMIIETIQAEGGVNIASSKWLQQIRRLCDQYNILLICDEVQVGCGRTGSFFSFEESEITPDIITMSKSISGYGLPMSIVLLKPHLDCWTSGQHNGTYRGNQHAFVTEKKALELRDRVNLDEIVRHKSELAMNYLISELKEFDLIKIRGKGLIIGVDIGQIDKNLAKKISIICFKKGLVIECAGKFNEVLKILPSLLISEKLLLDGLKIIVRAIKDTL